MTKIQIKSKIFVHLAGFLSFLITKGGEKDYPKASDYSDSIKTSSNRASDYSDREKRHYKSASDYSDSIKSSYDRASDYSDGEKWHYKSASDHSDREKLHSGTPSD